MLRVGLTGQLGSGKSTVARLLAAHGAHTFSADAIGRELMQPGQPVFHAIVAAFGPGVLAQDGSLDRAKLAGKVFAEDRIEELNAIVHPAVIAEQQQRAAALIAREPHAIVVVESALIFEAERDARKRGDSSGVSAWRSRFGRLVLVTAGDEAKIARFAARASDGVADNTDASRQDAQRRLAVQIPDAEKLAHVDYVIHNDGDIAELEPQVSELWQQLCADELRHG